MAQAAIPLAIIGTGLQIYGQIKAGEQAKDQAVIEANAANEQAQEDQRAANDQAGDLRRRISIMRDESEQEIARINRATLSEGQRVERAAHAANVGLRRQSNQLLGGQKVSFAKGGVTQTGTAAQVVAETGQESGRLQAGIEADRARIIGDLKRNRALEEIAIRHATDIDAETLETTATRAERRGRFQSEAGIKLSGRLRTAGDQAVTASKIGAGGSLLTGASNIFRMTQ